jgi:hypothetical protein
MLSLLLAAAQKWMEDEALTLGVATAFSNRVLAHPRALTVVAVASRSATRRRGALYDETRRSSGVSGAEAIQKAGGERERRARA